MRLTHQTGFNDDVSTMQVQWVLSPFLKKKVSNDAAEAGAAIYIDGDDDGGE